MMIIFIIKEGCYIFKYFIESPRWLHSKGYKDECIKALTDLSIFNGTQTQWYEFKNKNEELINKIGTPFLEKEDKVKDNNKNNENKNKNYKIENDKLRNQIRLLESQNQDIIVLFVF